LINKAILELDLRGLSLSKLKALQKTIPKMSTVKLSSFKGTLEVMMQTDYGVLKIRSKKAIMDAIKERQFLETELRALTTEEARTDFLNRHS
jgi:hypothetical protein